MRRLPSDKVVHLLQPAHVPAEQDLSSLSNVRNLTFEELQALNMREANMRPLLGGQLVKQFIMMLPCHTAMSCHICSQAHVLDPGS